MQYSQWITAPGIIAPIKSPRTFDPEQLPPNNCLVGNYPGAFAPLKINPEPLIISLLDNYPSDNCSHPLQLHQDFLRTTTKKLSRVGSYSRVIVRRANVWRVLDLGKFHRGQMSRGECPDTS